MPLITYDAGTTTDDLGTGAQQVAPVPGGSRLDADKYADRVLVYNGTATPIVVGDTLQLDLVTAGFVVGKWVAQGPAVADSPRVVGSANEAIAVGDWGMATLHGYVASLNVDAGVAAGDLLQQSATAGRAETAGATTQRGFAVALTAAAANRCQAWLY
jgi:hypothetical protein